MPEREGWPYIAALLGLRDVLAADGGSVTWPDAVLRADGEVAARLGVYAELGPGRVEWVTVTVLVEDAVPPRGALLARVLAAVERRLTEPADRVLADYRPHCVTLGRSVRARLIPLGPDGPEVVGEAVDVLADGALVVRTARGHRVAVPPQNLGLLEEPQGPVEPPEHLLGTARRQPPAP